MLRANESIFEYAERCRQASAEVEKRFKDWFAGMKRTTEEGRNNARRRIALEVHAQYGG